MNSKDVRSFYDLLGELWRHLVVMLWPVFFEITDAIDKVDVVDAVEVLDNVVDYEGFVDSPDEGDSAGFLVTIQVTSHAFFNKYWADYAL